MFQQAFVFLALKHTLYLMNVIVNNTNKKKTRQNETIMNYQQSDINHRRAQTLFTRRAVASLIKYLNQICNY